MKRENQVYVKFHKRYFDICLELTQKNPKALHVLILLIDHMDYINVVNKSQKELASLLNISLSTMYRALKVLNDMNAIKIEKSGVNNKFIINDDLISY